MCVCVVGLRGGGGGGGGTGILSVLNLSVLNVTGQLLTVLQLIFMISKS